MRRIGEIISLLLSPIETRDEETESSLYNFSYISFATKELFRRDVHVKYIELLSAKKKFS